MISLREVAEAFNPGNWGWGRRRRSLPAVLRDDATYAATKRAVITITRSEANSLLAVSKRGDICLRYVCTQTHLLDNAAMPCFG